jgi:hypothetical protein
LAYQSGRLNQASGAEQREQFTDQVSHARHWFRFAPSNSTSQRDIRAGYRLGSPAQLVGAKRMAHVIKMSTQNRKPTNLPKTAALTKAQAEHKTWLKEHGIKVTKNTLRT